MKIIYRTPETRVINISMQKLIASSFNDELNTGRAHLFRTDAEGEGL